MSEIMTTDKPMPDANNGLTAEQEAQQVLDDLEQLRSERDRLLDLAKRTQADFINYQQRIQRERQDERRFALAPLAKELLPVIDNLDRALAAAQDESPLKEGVRLVRTQLLEILKRHGITPIGGTGEPFDPNLHEAVGQQPATDSPPHTVLQVLEEGYRYHERVLRPSKVMVSSK